MLGRIEGLGDQAPDHAIGAVGVILTVLVLHNAFLDDELLLVERAEEVGHPIRFHGDGELGMGGRQVNEIVRAVGRGRAVDIGAERLEVFKKITGVMEGAFEHEMFEQVGKTALRAFFVLGANVIPEVHRRERGPGLVPDDDVEAVG